ncbi:hypothetical protein K470DRAFT_254984 [Piedraia hortae CBS 480.64]|uniref:Uncharacterized protein n=1 Tax=Piedraia hortae CBS 480.64 TaxID=1314780 RepID=A0A6A7C7T1_9PEZI|nr:hypothetical protein K470DRAFT_254984 [Piedraia hortae CBS 480.64]
MARSNAAILAQRRRRLQRQKRNANQIAQQVSPAPLTLENLELGLENLVIQFSEAIMSNTFKEAAKGNLKANVDALVEADEDDDLAQILFELLANRLNVKSKEAEKDYEQVVKTALDGYDGILKRLLACDPNATVDVHGRVAKVLESQKLEESATKEAGEEKEVEKEAEKGDEEKSDKKEDK